MVIEPSSTGNPRIRFDKGDARFIAVCLLVMVAGAFAFHFGFERAFPEASIDFRVTKDQARAIGERALADHGFDVKGFTALGLFDHDDDAKTYLERTLGLANASPLFSRTVPIWRWSFRWVKPLQKLEYRAFVAPTGEVLAFRRLLPEAEPAPDPGEDEARRLAEATLKETRGFEAAALRFVETTLERRPHRVDRNFVWESNKSRFGDAALRYLVEVQGDRPGRSSLFLKVPEKWRKEYQTLRSKNDAAGTVATFGLILTAIAILAVFIERVRRRDVRWRWALSFALVGFVLQLLSSLNELPLRLFDYETSEAWGGFVFKAILGSIGGAFVLGVLIALLVAAGEPLYREAFPGRPALGRIFSWRGVRSKTFFRGVLLGYAFTACFIAYQIVFYIVSEKLGAWAPAEVPYSNLLGTSFPWLAVLFMGFMPAATEEFSSRMFSIPFLRRYVPPWAAIVIAAMIWGFAHSTYPNQPFFIRGLEVGMAGIVLGIVMVRVGILPVLVWHFTFDALYTALILIRSSNPYFVVSGSAAAGLLLVPLGISLFFYLRNGGFETEEHLLNGAVGTAPALPVSERPAVLVFSPPRPLRLHLLAALVALSLALIALSRFALPREGAKPSSPFGIDRWGARRAADAFLKGQGEDPASYLAVPVARAVLPALEDESDSGAELIPYEWNPRAERWLLEKGGIPLLKRWAREILPGAVWQVRYVRPLDTHGSWVVVDARTGRVVGFKRTFPEDEPGASLDDATARARAMTLLSSYGIDAVSMRIVSANAQVRKARRDHRIVFESGTQSAAGAPRRVVVELAGDRSSLLATALKLPEEWVRARERSTKWTYLAIGWKVLGLGTLIGFFLIEFVRVARRNVVHWRALLWPAALLTIPALLKQIVSLPVALQTFRSELSLPVFSVFVLVGAVLGLILSFGLAFVALALIGAVREGALAAWKPRASSGPRALLAAGVMLLLLFACRSFSTNLATAWPLEIGFGGLSIPPGVDTLAPFFDLLDSIVKLALLLGAGAALAALLSRDFLAAAPMRFATALVAAGLFAPISARTLPEVLIPVLLSSIVATAFVAALAILLDDDPRAYLLAAALLVGVRGAYDLLFTGVTSYVFNGAALVAVLILLILWRGFDRPARTTPVAVLPAGSAPES